MVYRFLNIAIDCDRFLASAVTYPSGLEPRVLELIIYLVEQRHRMVPREELLRHVWNQGEMGPSGTHAGHLLSSQSAIFRANN